MARKFVPAVVIACACLAQACSADGSEERGRPKTQDGWRPASTPETEGMRDPGLANDPAFAPPAAMAEPGESERCGAGCEEVTHGAGGDAFDPDRADSAGVGLDPKGALVLRGSGGTGSKYIWIANTTENTVSKIDVESYVEEGRYLLDSGAPGASNGNFGVDPSRTSVSLEGDAFVGSRMGSALTRISSLGEDCPDTNGDGEITTSHGATEILPWGQDDCVLWQTRLSGMVRGVAAQDIGGETKVEPRLDGPPEITTTPGQHYVWVGNTESNLWKLDALTGAILIEMTAPTAVYGLAFNGSGILYSTAGGMGADFGWVDTNRCTDAASCAIARCDFTCTPTSCPSTCDGAVVARADLLLQPANTYGITVDCEQRVWLGGYIGPVHRYDPSLPADMRLANVPDSLNVHGIGADRDGWVWGAAGGELVRIEGDSLATSKLPIGGAKGIGIDTNGKVWVVSQAQQAYVVDPGADIHAASIVHTVTGLVGPYTYSDMTGEQLRLGTREPGYYREVFEGCPAADEAPTEWLDLSYDAELPDGTWIVFRARTADSEAGLAKAPWVDVAAAPGRDSPVEIAPFFGGMDLGRYVEVEVELLTQASPEALVDRCADPVTGDTTTPRVKSFGLSHRCQDTIE